ncbi:uncharacterized protein LOC115702517 [Cannabis sativa]|uniref:uncharacterized protein LOC115702517 n=1 Tax=Cannabis sativa TaxID=3483 RepID=UPI0029CA9B7D|nr:uncharacterized protein LOC115702517 [Cannabis sativa]
MGHTSARRKPAKGKSIRFGSAVSHECSDKNTDVRLQKRPKKKRRLRRKRTNKQIIDEDDSKDVDEDDLQDVDEHDSKDVDEDDLEDVDVDDLEDVDEEYLLTFLNDINEDSYITHVSRDKEDDPDYYRFIKLKPDQPLDVDCEQKDDGILYLKYLDVIEDDENTTPEKSDIVEEIQLGNEFDPKDESDDTCQDYCTFLDYLEKEGEETMFKDDDDDNVQILTTDENPRDVVNDTDLAEIESGEVAPTNLHSYNGPDFVL